MKHRYSLTPKRRAGTIVLFGEEMGGRQSSRLITSDGKKSFPCQNIATVTVESVLADCVCPYVHSQVCVSYVCVCMRSSDSPELLI